jgi:hypothetical protein
MSSLGGLKPTRPELLTASARRLRAALIVVAHRHRLQFRPIKQAQGNQQVV